MSTDIELLPLPTRLAASGLKSEIVNFAERLVEHNVAVRDAEIEALQGLLDEVRCCFTRDDDLPSNLLPRIDAALRDHDQEVGNGFWPEMQKSGGTDWTGFDG